MGSKELHLAVYNLLELRCVQLLLLGNIFDALWKENGHREWSTEVVFSE